MPLSLSLSPGLKCKKKSKTGGGESGDTQDKQPSASESDNEFQEAPQPKEAPQQAPQTVTQAPSEPQPERINYEHYNQFISPYRMEDDLEKGAIEFQRQVTKWMRIPPYS